MSVHSSMKGCSLLGIVSLLCSTLFSSRLWAAQTGNSGQEKIKKTVSWEGIEVDVGRARSEYDQNTFYTCIKFSKINITFKNCEDNNEFWTA